MRLGPSRYLGTIYCQFHIVIASFSISLSLALDPLTPDSASSIAMALIAQNVFHLISPAGKLLLLPEDFEGML